MLRRVSRAMGLVVAAFLVLGTAALLPGPDLHAGGGKNYTIRVHNPTGSNAWVRVRTSKVLCVIAEDKLLEPDESYTFNCGPWCPCGLEGEIYDKRDKTWKSLKETNIDGTRPERFVWEPLCESAVFEIGPNEAAGAQEEGESGFGFLKR